MPAEIKPTLRAAKFGAVRPIVGTMPRSVHAAEHAARGEDAPRLQPFDAPNFAKPIALAHGWA